MLFYIQVLNHLCTGRFFKIYSNQTEQIFTLNISQRWLINSVTENSLIKIYHLWMIQLGAMNEQQQNSLT